jgi:hypothetical protein
MRRNSIANNDILANAIQCYWMLAWYFRVKNVYTIKRTRVSCVNGFYLNCMFFLSVANGAVDI